MPTQIQIFYQTQRMIGELNSLFMDMVRKGDITRAELQKLIEKRPNIYGRFAGFLKTLP
jgi:hypothetical protein